MVDNFDPSSGGISPNTGLTQEQARMLGFGSIGQLGAMLMAAGQKQMPSERAKYLSQIGNIPGQMMQQADVMSQAQLRSAQAKLAQQQLEQIKNWQNLFGGAAQQGGSPAAPAAPVSNVTPNPMAMPSAVGPMVSPNAPARVLPQSAGGPALTPAQNVIANPMPPSANPPPAMGGTNGPTLNASSIPNIIGSMDPSSRAMLGVLGPKEGGQLLLNETNARARQNLEIQAANERQQREIQAANERQSAGFAVEPVTITATAPNGQVVTKQTTKANLSAITQELVGQGYTLGEPKPTEFQKDVMKRDSENYKEWAAARDSVPVSRARILDMQDAAKNFQPGRGTSAFMEMGGYLNNAFNTDAFVDKNALGSYDAFAKNSLQLIGAQVKDQEGARAAASLWSMLQKGQPTAETSSEGMQRMFRFMQAQLDYSEMKGNAADDWVSKYGALRTQDGKVFEREFAKNVSFDQFLGNYLKPEELAALSPEQRKRFGK